MKLLLAAPQFAVFAMVDLKDAVLKIKDGGANELTVKIGDGNLTYSEATNIIYQLNQGKLDDVRKGDEVPMDVSFGFMWQYVQPTSAKSGNAMIRPEDALGQKGPCSAWVSSDPDLCRPYAVDLELTLTGSCLGRNQKITFPDFRKEKLDFDLKSAQVTCSGKCNATAATVDNN